MLAFLFSFVVLFFISTVSLLVLNRAKGPAGLMRGRQIYILGVRGRCGVLLNISEIWGAG